MFGDERLLETLLSNLVGNSLKYVPSDRDPHVLIDAVEEEETGWPVIRVSDNGNPLEDSARLFEMFQRGAADDRAVGAGSASPCAAGSQSSTTAGSGWRPPSKEVRGSACSCPERRT